MNNKNKYFLTSLFTILISFGGTDLLANDNSDAKEVYTRATEYFTTGDYESALENFKESYNLSGKPAILYNIALCYEKQEDPARAIAYYGLYLDEVPDSSDAAYVRKKIETLKNPPKEEKVEEVAKEEPAKKQEEKVSTPEIQQPVVQLMPEETISRKKLGQGLLIGGGSLVFASGLLTGITAFKKYNSFESICAPNCSDDDVSKVKGLSIASDIQIFTGVAAIAAGLIWMIVDKKKSSKLEISNAKHGFVPSFNGTSFFVEF